MRIVRPNFRGPTPTMPSSVASKSADRAAATDVAPLHPKKSFQDLIFACSASGPSRAASILQPYDMEVGAGTFHPATTLRALGPKPWNAAYVAALAPPHGRPLRREPEPAAALLPVPGDHEAVARRHAGPATSSSLRRIGIDRRSCTTSASSRTTGRARRWAPGAWAGRCGATAWR